jgi:hypothetical protein
MQDLHPRPRFGATIATTVCVVRNTNFLEETNMAKSTKKGKLTSKKLEKKVPLTALRGR